MKPALSVSRIPFYFLLSSLIVHLSTCQGYSQDFGGFRPGIRWQQINTPVIRVIFPEGLETQAGRVANNILYLNRNSTASIGPLSKKLNLVLNNQGTISNGYVTLMPYRSEFFTTPMQDGFSLGSLPWLDLLSVHEYRHALQYANMRQGYTKLAWWLMGDAGWGAMMNITTPDWFFEGDAVATETALTDQGRGRLPSFTQQYRSILLHGRKYSYMKARNGSYRDMVPNAYELGYLLCSYGREKYGNDLWLKVMRRNSWLKGIIYPFSDAVMVYTGMSTRKFYKTALSEYKENWTEEISLADTTPRTRVSASSKTVTEYRFPVYQPNGDLLVYKESYKEAGAIYRVNPNGQEFKVCAIGISLDPYFTTSGNRITWSEVTWDERFSSQNYSDVVVYQTDLRKKIYLTRKQRYFSPAISPDGTRIVVAEVDSASHCRLKILDSRTGAAVSILPNQEDYFYTYPKWEADGNSIISSVRTTAGRMLIIQQHLSNGIITKLSGEYNQVFGEVFVSPETILFTSGFSGINNIFSLSRSSGTISQLTGSRFGAYFPAVSPDNKRLAYSDFGIKGYGLVSVSMDSLLWKQIEPALGSTMNKPDFSYFQTEGGNILGQVPARKMEASPYRPWQHPFRVHSWTFSPGFYSAGINLVSDNILNNLHLEAGANYYYNESAPGFNAKIKYGGLYPILSAGISRYYRHPDILDVVTGTETNRPTSFDNEYSFEIQVPMNFTKGENFRQADISFGYDYISNQDLTDGNSDPGHVLQVSALSGQASFSTVRKKAYQNIATPFGISLKLTAKQSVGFTYASQYQAIADFALRGLAPNHHVVLSAGFVYEPNRNPYHFMDLFLYPRGFTIPKHDWMFTFQSAYHLPLVYPDFGFWGILYCQRVRSAVFADFAYASVPRNLDTASTGIFGSVGTELIFDTRWFNLAEIPLGIRFSVLLTPDFEKPLRKTRFEFVVPIIRL